MTTFWRPIFFVNGILLSIVGGAMLLPMCADLLDGSKDWQAFAASSVFTTFIGMSLFFTNRGYQDTVKIRQAFLITSTSYFTITLFAAIPLCLSELRLSLADAYFEMASGITTTGASVIADVEHAPSGVLLWRALINLLGGVGIVVMALAILPMLKIGGMQLFRTESSDKSEKILPRMPQIATAISVVIFCLTALCSWCYWLAGMSGFDAICHAMSTIATGGFSTHNTSIGYYNSLSIELIAIIFMIAGSLPLMLYFQAVTSDVLVFFRNSQVQVFLGVIAVATLLLTVWLTMTNQMQFGMALRHSLFATVTILSTTGFVTADFAHWGAFATTLLFMLMAVGGCTGSTAGAIKIFRFQVLYEVVKMQLRQLIQPHGVFVPRYEGKPVPETVVASVTTFLLLYASCFAVFSMIVSAFGLDFITAMSAVAQAIGNVGVGLGGVIGPTGNFSSLADGAKWALSIAMIMGRLELFTVIVIFTPMFWNR
jgi:trk system potassium uptake protein